MKKLMTSLVAATMVGAFSLSALAADTYPANSATPATAAIAEKPAHAPKKHVSKQKASKKHTAKHKTTKLHEAGAPALPASAMK